MSMFLKEDDEAPRCAHNVPGCGCQARPPERSTMCEHSPSSCSCHAGCSDKKTVLMFAGRRILEAFAAMRKDGNGLTLSQEQAVMSACEDAK